MGARGRACLPPGLCVCVRACVLACVRVDEQRREVAFQLKDLRRRGRGAVLDCYTQSVGALFYSFMELFLFDERGSNRSGRSGSGREVHGSEL